MEEDGIQGKVKNGRKSKVAKRLWYQTFLCMTQTDLENAGVRNVARTHPEVKAGWHTAAKSRECKSGPGDVEGNLSGYSGRAR